MDFRFVCLAMLAVVSLAVSAPVANEKELKLEKRAQEVIAYGNQQNAPRLKKRDPALAERKTDVDSDGKIVANPAESLKPEEGSSSSAEAAGSATSSSESGEQVPASSAETAAAAAAANDEDESASAPASNEQGVVGDVPEVGVEEETEVPSNMAAFEESMMGENAVQTNNELPGDAPSASVEGDDVDDLLSQLKSEAEETEKEEEEKEGKKKEEEEENETTALARPEDLEEDYQNYFTNYNLLRKYNSLMGGQAYRPQYPTYTQYYRRRRSSLRRRHARRLAPHARRIKRDLLDDNDYVYLPYGLPPPYLSQQAAFYPRELYPEQWGGEEELEEGPDPEEEQREELLAELMAMKEEEEREEEEEKEKEMLDLYSLLYSGQGRGDYLAPYLEEEEQGEAPELEEEGQEEYPLYKRQLLSELPGLKKRYFYPYSREPETHWPAFVPQQKRQYGEEYGDAYAQVMRLAQELAQEERRGGGGYLDGYFDGEKKK